MESLFKIMYFLVASDPEYHMGDVRDNLLGINEGRGDVFENTFLLSFLIAIALSAVYYLVLNRFFTLNKLWIWLIVLVLNGLANFLVSYYLIGSYVYEVPLPIEALGWKFIGMSTLYGMLYFYLFSLLFKRWSVFAKFIPH